MTELAGALTCGIVGMAWGAWLVWLCVSDKLGRCVVPDSVEYRSYWVHDGRRFYAGERDDPYVPPRRLRDDLALSLRDCEQGDGA